MLLMDDQGYDDDVSIMRPCDDASVIAGSSRKRWAPPTLADAP